MYFMMKKIWKTFHTGSNFILILIARAISNFSKNDTFLMSRIWKMGRNLFSSLAIKDNLKVAFLEKNSTNPNKYLVTSSVTTIKKKFEPVCILSNIDTPQPKSCYFTFPSILKKIPGWTFRFNWIQLPASNSSMILKFHGVHSTKRVFTIIVFDN